jgi:hypothetical protein
MLASSRNKHSTFCVLFREWGKYFYFFGKLVSELEGKGKDAFYYLLFVVVLCFKIVHKFKGLYGKSEKGIVLGEIHID